MGRVPPPLRPVDLPDWTRARAAEQRRRALLERWSFRHAEADALGRWGRAAPGRGGLLAFSALVEAPGLLARLTPVRASLLARDAAGHADRLQEDLGHDPASPTSAAIAEVRGAIASWRRDAARAPSSRPAAGRNGGGAARPRTPPRADQAEDAAAAVTRLGADGLGRLASRATQILAGTVVRHLGGLLRRGRLPPGGWDAARGPLLTLQAHAASAGARPFLVPWYRPSGALTAGQAAAVLSADLRACGAAAALAGGPAAGRDSWGAAEEAHAFAALALDPNAPAVLPPAARARLLRAARRALDRLDRRAPR